MSASSEAAREAYTTSWLGKLSLSLAGGYLIVLLAMVVMRVRYPFELEWIEGGMVQHVERLRAGQPLYAPPSLTFIPDIYTPLYYAVCAALAKVIGIGFFPLRLVSVVSSFALFGALFMLARRETDDRLAGVIAAGLFAACYRLSGAWLEPGGLRT